MINITRAFGDQDLKAACGIISSPEIIVKKLDSDPNSESFLVLSSDGLDCVPSDKVCAAVTPRRFSPLLFVWGVILRCADVWMWWMWCVIYRLCN